MHMRGRPEEWRTLPPPGDIFLLVKRELREWAEAAVLVGVRREKSRLIPVLASEKASSRTIRCWRVFRIYSRWASP